MSWHLPHGVTIHAARHEGAPTDSWWARPDAQQDRAAFRATLAQESKRMRGSKFGRMLGWLQIAGDVDAPERVTRERDREPPPPKPPTYPRLP